MPNFQIGIFQKFRKNTVAVSFSGRSFIGVGGNGILETFIL